MVNAIIFDVDGTLLDSETIYMEAWRQTALRKGMVMPESALRRTRAVKRERAMEIFQEELGPAFSYMEWRPMRVEIENQLFQNAADLTKPGVRKLLDYLQDKQIPMGVASTNFTADTKAHLAQFGLLDYFSVIVGGDQVQCGKPDPEIFLKAAALLGVSPKNCLAIGDTPADVLSATGGGLPIILVPDQVQPEANIRSLSLAVFSSLEEALPLVCRLTGD